jgi:hypothetical protein
MATAERFEELEVWQRARELTRLIYLDRNYLSPEQFDTALRLAETCSKQIARFMQYLQSQPNTRRIREDEVAYHV